MSPLTPQPAPLSPDDRRALLWIAKQSISHGLTHLEPLSVDVSLHPPALGVVRATFVTLHIEEELRGCIGTLTAKRPLAQDIADNAFAAAFRDTRFEPVREYEYHLLRYHLSILHPAEAMNVTSEAELLTQLRPGVDGLILEEPGRRATFLPDVWRMVPDARQFVEQLKLKAGFDADYWSPRLRAWRYTTESVE